MYTKNADPKISHPPPLTKKLHRPATSVEKPRPHEILLTNTKPALSRRLLPLPSLTSGALIIAGRSDCILHIAQVLFGAIYLISFDDTKKKVRTIVDGLLLTRGGNMVKNTAALKWKT